MSNHACVIFDLDGTLADTKQGIVRGFQYAAKEMGFAYLPQYENSIIGPSLIDSFRHLYGLPEEEAREAVRHYRAYYYKQCMFEYSLYEGIENLIKTLRKEGRTLAVATTKYQKYALLMLENSRLIAYFDCVAGSMEDGSRAGKKELLEVVMEQTAYSAQQCIMIGDKHYDGEGAACYKMDFIWAKYGYGKEEEMREIPITFVAENVKELYQYFALCT